MQANNDLRGETGMSNSGPTLKYKKTMKRKAPTRGPTRQLSNANLHLNYNSNAQTNNVNTPAHMNSNIYEMENFTSPSNNLNLGMHSQTVGSPNQRLMTAPNNYSSRNIQLNSNHLNKNS